MPKFGLQEISVTIATLIGGAALFIGCHRQPDPTFGPEMRSAYSTASQLYVYVWNSDLFSDPRHEARINRLIGDLAGDFHRVEAKAPLQMFEPGFTVTLAAQRELLADVQKKFQQGSKDYAQWRLQSVSQNCISCHSRFNAPVDFIGAGPELTNSSFEGQFGAAKLLFATRQFDQASAKLFSLARSVGGLRSGSNQAFQSLQLWLTIQVRVKSRYEAAAKELAAIRQEIHLSPNQDEAVNVWINELEDLAEAGASPSDLPQAQLLLEPLWELDTIQNDNLHLVDTLRASAILHGLLLSEQPLDERRSATLLLALAYVHLPIQAFEGFPLLYLEQCIREFPKSAEAQKAYSFYEDILLNESTGSGGLHLDEADRRKLVELKNLANGKHESLEQVPFASQNIS